VANLGPAEVALDGVILDRASSYDFTGSAIATLPAGARVLVTSDAAAARSGMARSAHRRQLHRRIDNGGETLRLLDRYGFVIQEFAYDDEETWPPEADGRGRSLECLDPNGNAAEPCNWQASPRVGGSAGQPEFVQPRLAAVTVPR